MIDDDFPPYTRDDELVRATCHDGQTRISVYQPAETVVVLGSGSRPEVELNLGACLADRVPILRRRGGGCAVVLDPGNVVVSVVMTGLPFGHHRRHFDVLSSWLIAGLERCGFSGLEQAGICDLVRGDRKVGGACLHRAGDLLHYSASLLVAPDMERVSRYLAHPPREPDYRRGRSHRDFMGSLAGVTADAGSHRSEDRAGLSDSAEAECLAARLRAELEVLCLEEPAGVCPTRRRCVIGDRGGIRIDPR